MQSARELKRNCASASPLQSAMRFQFRLIQQSLNKSFYESGGFGSNGYLKGWKINVVNRPFDLQNVVRIGHSAQLTSIL